MLLIITVNSSIFCKIFTRMKLTFFFIVFYCFSFRFFDFFFYFRLFWRKLKLEKLLRITVNCSIFCKIFTRMKLTVFLLSSIAFPVLFFFKKSSPYFLLKRTFLFCSIIFSKFSVRYFTYNFLARIY